MAARASGPRPLVDFVEKLTGLLRAREGRSVRPIDAADILCTIGELVVSGNVRRSAIIIIGDPWDKEYLKAKRWDLGILPSYRAMANFSVAAEDVDDLHPYYWKTYEAGEAFGIVNRKNIQAYGRMGEKKKDTATGVNPCVTGDTLVAVADGRDHVSMKELAIQGKDVPVYCLDDKGMPVIRMMRNPRITGYQQKIFKVVLDDGNSVRVTENHKFLTKEGIYKQVSDLKIGDSLTILGKRQEPNPVDMYWKIQCNDYAIPEHRMIAQFNTEFEIDSSYDVHHKDHNSLNNSPYNLEVLKKAEHSSEHGDRSIGEGNGRWSGFSNEEIYQHIKDLTLTLKRRIVVDDWIEHAKKLGLPQRFSAYRTNTLGSLSSLFVNAADELNIEDTKERNLPDPRSKSFYRDLVTQGYNLDIEGSSIFVIKNCSACANPMRLIAAKREVCYCSSTCANKSRSKDIYEKSGKAIKSFYEEKHAKVREEQVRVFKKTQEELGCLPKKKEWVKACKKERVSYEISRKSSPFTSWAELISAAENFNHKIVSVFFDGHEDVYNGTVEEFHNYFIGGFVSKTQKKQRKKFLYINNLNCGEACLESGEPCNLQEIFLPNLTSPQEFFTAAKLMHRWGKRVTCETYHNPKNDEVVKRNRRIGTGITGCLQAPTLFKKEVLDAAYTEIQRANVEYSAALNIPESIRTTVIKPSGTLSLLGETTPGIHPSYSKFYIRRVRFSSNDKLIPILRAAGHYIEPVKKLDGTLDHSTVVVDFYCKTPDNTPCADAGFDTEKQLDTLLFAQKHWSDQAVSVTVYYKRDNIEQIKAWLAMNLKNIKTISFLCYNEHGFQQAPLESISEEEYNKGIADSYSIKVEDIGSGDLESLECEGGTCPIK